MQIGSFVVERKEKFKENLKKELRSEFNIPKGKELSSADSSEYWGYDSKPYNPDALWQKKGSFDLYDQMLEDDQISACLTLKKLIILNADWEIESENEAAAEFIEKCFTDYLDDVFAKKLYEILSALGFGFSVTEKIPNVVETENGAKFVWEKLKTRAPHTFELPTDEKGNLIEITQYSDTGPNLHLDPKKFILYSYKKEFDNPYGRSELNRGVYRAYISKDALIKFWNMRLERFGNPLAVGKIPRQSGDAEKNIFKQVIKNIQAKTAMTMPDDFELELLEATKGTEEFKQAIEKHDLMIARKMLIPDLLGFSGEQTSGGSYSLGQEQFALFYATIEYDRNDLARIINKELVAPLVLWNFGSGVEVKFKFKKVDDKRRQEDLKNWLEAVKTGKVPALDKHVNWFLDKINAPEITAEEFNKVEEKKEKMREQIGGNNAEEDNKQDKNGFDNKKKQKDSGEEDGKKFASDTPRQYQETIFYRPLSKYEKKIDFAKIDEETEEIEEEYTEELSQAFTLSINALTNEIKTKRIIENKRIDKVNKLELKYIPKIKSIIKNVYKDSVKLGAGTFERKFKIIEDITPLDAGEVADWMEEMSIYTSNQEAEYILGKVKPIVIEGIRGGRGPKEIMVEIETAMKGYDLALDANRVDTIVRNATNAGFNEARLQKFNKLGDEIIAYQYSAIRDGRTSQICLALDKNGQGFYKPSEIAGINPPNHHRCRSILIPIFKGEEVGTGSIPGDIEQSEGSFWKMRKE